MSSLLRLLSLACTVVLVLSFAMFASDQASSGSKKTVAQIAADGSQLSTPAPAQQPAKRHGAVRRAIDDANDTLVSPFKGVVASSSPWTTHIAQGVLAFLVFGLGLGFVARYAAGRGI